MNTLLQAFARLPQSEPESHWLAYTLLVLSGFAAGFFLGRWLEQRRSYNSGYLEGFRNGITAHEGDISYPHKQTVEDVLCGSTIPPRAPTIKISPRPVKSPFTVSSEGQLARDMGWNKGGREIGNGNG